MILYSSNGLEKLKHVLCSKCKTKPNYWSKDIFRCWLRYIKVCDRKYLINGTRFASYFSLKPHFRKHPCYKNIARIKKLIKPVKYRVKIPVAKFPWLLGLYYADGSKHSGTQLSFGLSLHERIIADKALEYLYKILGKDAHIVIEKIGKMLNVRTHSTELCRAFPDKRDEKLFSSIWKKFDDKDKLEFIGGYIDGDGSCSFEDGITSLQIFSKIVSFIPRKFYLFLHRYGYMSLKDFTLYLSPTVGRTVKPFTLKQYIKKPYSGKIDTQKVFELLKEGISIRKIAKQMDCNKKTISLALRRVYGGLELEKYIFAHRKV